MNVPPCAAFRLMLLIPALISASVDLNPNSTFASRLYDTAATRTSPPVPASRLLLLKSCTILFMNVFISTGVSHPASWRFTADRDVSIINTTSAATGQLHVVVVNVVVVVEVVVVEVVVVEVVVVVVSVVLVVVVVVV